MIRRYLRLYLHFLEFSFVKAMEFRLDFFMRIVMDIIYYAVNIGFFRVIYAHTPSLGGWNESQTMLFVSIFLLIDAIQMTVFTSNLWSLPAKVTTGSLDYYLTRPVSSLFFLSLQEFAASSVVNVLIVFGIVIWALGLNSAVVTPGSLVLLTLLVINGVLLYFLIAMAFIIPVFWTHSGRGFAETFYLFTRFMERPDRIFTGTMRLFTTVLLPCSLVASFPARLFLEGFDWGVFLHLIGVTCLFALSIRWVWAKGLAAYSSASS
jgi:ABC-2 type transport system permease protein